MAAKAAGFSITGPMNIINSTITGNSAIQQADGGAGIFNNGTLNLTNSTITGTPQPTWVEVFATTAVQ